MEPREQRFDNRLRVLQEILRERGLTGAILFHSRDVLYYTGTAQPSYLVVRPDDYRLFVRRGMDFAVHQCPFEPERIVAESNLARICQQMLPGAAGAKIGSELDLLPMNQGRAFHLALGGGELVDISGDILRQRMIKDETEIAAIKTACHAVHAGHLALVEQARPGMTELEMSALVEHAHRLAGNEGAFFMRGQDFFMSRGPFASGLNLRHTSGVALTITGVGLSAAVPAGPSLTVPGRGDLVVVDIPTCIDGYHADQSRSYSVEAFPDRAVELYERLRDVADTVAADLRPGMTTGDAFAVAEAKAADLGLEHAFLNFASGAKAHFIGHGVGLELNEPPMLVRNGKTLLKEGMVLTLEMHVMEYAGHTLKLEDMVYLGANGVEFLTISPRDLSLVAAGH